MANEATRTVSLRVVRSVAIPVADEARRILVVRQFFAVAASRYDCDMPQASSLKPQASSLKPACVCIDA
jgi:hypothetical protein